MVKKEEVNLLNKRIKPVQKPFFDNYYLVKAGRYGNKLSVDRLLGFIAVVAYLVNGRGINTYFYRMNLLIYSIRYSGRSGCRKFALPNQLLFAAMNYIFYLLALLTGIAITVQAGVNAQLRQMLSHPVLAAMISFGIGFISLVGFQLISGGAWPSPETLRSITWWKWTGGVIGAIYVTTVVISVPRIGAASLVSLSVAGQLVAAIVFDHYGWLGFSLHPANGWRLLGAFLIMAGVLLVVRN